MSSSSSSSTMVASLAALGHTITEKLARDNFLVWKAQVLPHVRVAGLMGYLDGTMAEPPAVLTTETDVAGKKEISSTPNPAHVLWYTQDQQVLTFLLASLSRDVLLQVHSLASATGVWTVIQQMFASHSRARHIQLSGQLSNTKKGDSPVAIYFTKMKGFADEMAAAGKPIDDDELVSYILQGLDSDYNPYVAALSSRPEADQKIGLTELFSLLNTAEARIDAQNGSNTNSFSINLASKGGSRNNNDARSSGHGGGNSGAAYHGAGGGFFPNAAAPPPSGGRDETCQICKRRGHAAWRCFKRYDKNFNPPPKRQGGGGGNSGGGGGNSGGGNTKSANTVSAAYGVDTNWYLDTGTTDHVTGELEKLVVHDRYTGPEQIHTTSGQGNGGHNSSRS